MSNSRVRGPSAWLDASRLSNDVIGYRSSLAPDWCGLAHASRSTRRHGLLGPRIRKHCRVNILIEFGRFWSSSASWLSTMEQTGSAPKRATPSEQDRHASLELAEIKTNCVGRPGSAASSNSLDAMEARSPESGDRRSLILLGVDLGRVKGGKRGTT